MNATSSPGDEWSSYYRGYRLQTNPNGDVWWQVYNGTERLYVEPTPDELVEDLLSLKRLGGRVRVTEAGAVITRIEDGDDYEDLYVGDLSLSGKLIPEDQTEFSVDIRPEGLSSGDLWPSVYDGSKFSFSEDRIWWQHPQTHKRHPVKTELPDDVMTTLQRLKPSGGSFRVTPWNDVITLVEDPPNPEATREQLHNLPRVIKNIIVLRREHGVERLPVYVGSLDTVPLEVSEPRSLTDALSADERAQLDSWSGSLGPTEEIDPDEHRIDDATKTHTPDDPEDW
ncbi:MULTISPECIES: hypothetical protein [Halobacterium]|uniref:hypothetical protein n=1 Tax=Halobacterium TaxID=2239 RepID=UPI00073E342D|nr:MULTISPECIES: hypothetical protein [Halobacterium]MCG1004723.1 hypothetical protein [Halobacterium noricense]